FLPVLVAGGEGGRKGVGWRRRGGADVTEPVPAGQRKGYGGRVPPAGATPLLLAVQNAHYELAAYLLEEGADPNAALTGYTPLHAITAVRKPGVGDNEHAPGGYGSTVTLDLATTLTPPTAH